MNTQLQIFQGLEFPVVEADNHVWFRATESCKVLGFSNAYETVKTHCKEHQYREWQVGKGRPSLYVLESGLYRLILRSKKPEAVEFQDWLTEDVLPKLRKQGYYVDPAATSEQLAEAQKTIEQLQEALLTLDAHFDIQSAKIAEQSKDIAIMQGDRIKLSLAEMEVLIANRDVQSIEEYRLKRGEGKLPFHVKQKILNGTYRLV